MLDQKLKYRRFKAYFEGLMNRTFGDQEYDDKSNACGVFLEQSREMGRLYEKASAINPTYADTLFTLWIENKDETNNLLRAMGAILANPPNPQPSPVPTPGPTPGPITGFKEVPEWRNDELYFSIERPDGILAAGCWNTSGEQTVDLMKLLPGKKELWQRFPAETSFVDLREHNGRWYGISEQYQSRAAIIRLEGAEWKVVYQHEECDLALGMVDSPDDGYLYVSMTVNNGNWDLGQAPSGLVRSKTGDPGTWEWIPERHVAGYSIAGLCMHDGPRGLRVHGAGGNDLFSGAALVSECHPENVGDGDELGQARHAYIIEDQEEANYRSVMWSICSFKGILLTGGSTFWKYNIRCRIGRVRFDIPKHGYPASLETIYTLPQGYNAVYWIGADSKGEKCYALVTREDGNGNGMVLVSTDGLSWDKLWDAPCPVLWDAFFDPIDGKMKIAGGQSNSEGKIFESY